MLLYGNITAESCLFVEHEPENFSSEINKYQMEFLTAVHEAKTNYIEDIAFANGDKKIVTEALKDFAKTVKQYWDRFWAWVNNVFDRWIKHIKDFFKKPTVDELVDKCSDLLEDASKRSILASFVYRAPAVNLHRNLISILNRGFNVAVKKAVEPLNDIEHWDEMEMIGRDDPSYISNAIDSVSKILDKDCQFIDSEKPVREVKYEDMRTMLDVFVVIPDMLDSYRKSLNSFKVDTLGLAKDWGDFHDFDKKFPELVDIMQALSFTVQKHLEKINAETERAVSDYGKLLSSWYPAAMKRIYEEEYA